MYEETKIKFDWKGFLLKFAIIILVVILVIKLLPTKQKSHSESFTSNLTKLKDVSINYFQNKNLPEKENDTKVVTLSDLIVSGKISKLQDSKGKECDEENSYIEATKNGNEYEVEVYLKCGNEEETIYVYKTSCDETKCSETTTTTTKKVATSKKANNNSIAKIRLTKVVFSADNAILGSFIPVRFTNEDGVSEGAMYDKVSGQLYRNQGTGAFVIGPDKTT